MANCKVIIEGNTGTLVYTDVPGISNTSSIDDVINALPENSLNEINNLLKTNKGTVKVVDLTLDNNEFTKHVIGNYNSLTIEDRFKQEFNNFKGFSPYTQSLLNIAKKVFNNANFILVSNFDFKANQTNDSIKGKLLRYEKENPLILIKGTDFNAVENTLTHELTHLFFFFFFKENEGLQQMLTGLLENLTTRLDKKKNNPKIKDDIIGLELMIDHINSITKNGKVRQNEIFAYLFQSNDSYNYIKENYQKEFDILNDLMRTVEPAENVKIFKPGCVNVNKIISGAQTGVDQIGLVAALVLGLKTGGTAPFDYKVENKPNLDGTDNLTTDELKELGVVPITQEMHDKFWKNSTKTPNDWNARTYQNVYDSDGTVYFNNGNDSAGYLATKKYADLLGKPFISNPTTEQLTQWLIDNNIQTLNVAGNRGSAVDAKMKENVMRTLIGALEPSIDLSFDELGSTKRKKKEKPKFIFNPEQQKGIDSAIDFIENGDPSKFMIIEGKAGTGKTTIIPEFLDRFQDEKSIGVAALSNKAKSVIKGKLGDAEIVARDFTLAKLLGLKEKYIKVKDQDGFEEWKSVFERDLKNPIPPPIKKLDIIIVDEASMVNEEFLEMIMKEKRPEAKVIFLGDIGQLSPIREESIGYYSKKENKKYIGKKSPVFDENHPLLSKNHKSKLITRVRQGEDSPILEFADYPWDKSQNLDSSEITEQVFKERKNKINPGGAIMYTNSYANIRTKVLEAFKHAKENNLPNYIKYVAYRNITVNSVNKDIHDYLFGKNAPLYNNGELMIFTKNLGDEFENSTEFRVINTPSYVSNYSIEYGPLGSKNIPVWELDIEITNPDGTTYKSHIITIEPKFKEEHNNMLQKWADIINANGGGRLWAPFYSVKNRYADIDYSYAITSHKSQGSTYDNVIVDEQDIQSVTKNDKNSKNESLYTALTRSRNTVIVISNEPVNSQQIPDVKSLNEQINSSKNGVNYTEDDLNEEDSTFEADVDNDDETDTREKPFSVQTKTMDFDKMLPHLQWDNEKKTFKNINEAQEFFERYKNDEIGLANVWAEAEDVTTPMQVMTIKAGDLVRLPSLDYLKAPKGKEVGLFGPAEKHGKLMSRAEILDRINTNLSDLVKYRAALDNRIAEWNKFAKTKIPNLTDEVFQQTVNNQIEYKSKYYDYTPVNGKLVGDFSEEPNANGKKYLNIKPNYIVGRVFYDKINNVYKAYVAIKFKNKKDTAAMLINLDPKYINSIRRMNSDFRQEYEYENGEVKLDSQGNPVIKEKSAKYDSTKLSQEVRDDANINLNVLKSITGELNGLDKNSVDPLLEKYTTKKGNTIYRSTPHGIMISGFYGELREPLKEASVGDYVKFISKRVGKSVVSDWGVKLMDLPGGILVLTQDGTEKVITANNASAVVFNKSNLTKYLNEVGELVDETKALTFKQKQNPTLNKDFSIYPFWDTADPEKRRNMAKTLKKGDYVKIMFKNKEGKLIEFVAPILFVTNNKIYYGTSKTIETVNGKNSKETSEEKVNSINSIDIESFTEGKWVQNGQDWSFSGYNDVNQPFIRAAYVDHREHRNLVNYMTEYLKDIETNKKTPWKFEEKQYVALEDLTKQLTGAINNPQNKLQKMSINSEWAITNFEDNVDIKSRKLAGLISGDLVKTTYTIGEDDKAETRYKWGMVVGQDERTSEPIVAIFGKNGKLLVRKKSYDEIVAVGERTLPIYMNKETGEFTNYEGEGLIQLSEGRPDRLQKLETLYSEFFEKGLKTVNMTNEEYLKNQKLIEAKFRNHEKVPLKFVQYKDSDLKDWVLNFDAEKHKELDIKDSPEKEQVYRIRRKIGNNLRDVKHYQMVSGQYSLYNAPKATFDDVKSVVTEGDTMTLEVTLPDNKKMYVPGIVTEVSSSAIQISAVRKDYDKDSQETTYSTDTYTWFKPNDKYPSNIRLMELNGSNKTAIIGLGQKLHKTEQKESKVTKNFKKSFDNRESINLISDKLGDLYNVKTTLLTNDEMISLGEKYKSDFSNSRAFALSTGEIFINVDKASIAEPLHELAHIIMPGLKAKNPKAYNELISKIKDHPSYWDIAQHYPELSEQDLDEEVFVTIFAEYFREKMISNDKNEWLDQNFSDLSKNVSTVLSDIFDNDTRGDASQLMNMSLEEIMSQFGFDMISGRFAPYYDLSVHLAIQSKVQKIFKSLRDDGKIKEIC